MCTDIKEHTHTQPDVIPRSHSAVYLICSLFSLCHGLSSCRQHRTLSFITILPPVKKTFKAMFCYVIFHICHHTDVSVLPPSSQAPVVHRDSQERGVYQARPALQVLQRLPVPTSPSRTTVRPRMTHTDTMTQSTQRTVKSALLFAANTSRSIALFKHCSNF